MIKKKIPGSITTPGIKKKLNLDALQTGFRFDQFIGATTLDIMTPSITTFSIQVMRVTLSTQ
jgi:hypothetical protein